MTQLEKERLDFTFEAEIGLIETVDKLMEQVKFVRDFDLKELEYEEDGEAENLESKAERSLKEKSEQEQLKELVGTMQTQAIEFADSMSEVIGMRNHWEDELDEFIAGLDEIEDPKVGDVGIQEK